MKWTKLGFAAVSIFALLCIGTLAFGKSADYLVPVTIKKADKTEIRGYIVLHAEEILRMGSGTPSKKWQDPRRLVEFELMKFMEGGSEVYVSYRFEKEPLCTVNFFSSKGIHFTTSSSNPHVLPHYLHPGKIRWIKRTGRPMSIN